MKALARMLLVVTLLIAGLIATLLWMAQGLQSPTRVDVSPIHLTQVEPTTTDTATKISWWCLVVVTHPSTLTKTMSRKVSHCTGNSP